MLPGMNTDAILSAFDHHEVDAILIGGMNFLLRHQPVLTFDIDFWVRDTDDNLARAAGVLRELDAEWGRNEKSWAALPGDHAWLRSQTVFCLTSPHGAIDIFREVRGLEGQYEACHGRSRLEMTASGIRYRSLSDEDMLACQLALPENERRLDRVAFLKKHLGQSP
jgi:hypothetical protein